ncbi:alpha-methylacyl-CoA racemase-like [Limulus polyphemus]|uniref:Alpha-methylacyl-CoA racemase-like n=1 Tax=Limulus polyphemus TaxID=6850 RepID=A0ABM1BQL5_LIMPO|nr:alpha-methylacyl-CoA racemase-like [Limulus polyphemus]
MLRERMNDSLLLKFKTCSRNLKTPNTNSSIFMALRGIKVIELSGLAPAPFCGMVLSDFGASVLRIDRPQTQLDIDTLARGKKSAAINIKQPEGVKILKQLCSRADVLIEPYRRGVMEKLGLGPDILLKDNAQLIYARLSGYGHTGQYSSKGGHDINYLAISGILSMLGNANSNPIPPLNLLGDFCGGGLMCALGICLALYVRTQTGEGQVVDASMVEGSTYLGSWLWTSRSIKSLPLWTQPRGKNMLDGGAPFYNTYSTQDGKYMAVGSIEPKFYSELLKGLDLKEEDCPQFNNWPETHKKFIRIFATKTQEEWCQIFNKLDACVTPVLSLQEASSYAHNCSLETFMKDSVQQMSIPRPAPKLSKSPSIPSLIQPIIGQHSEEVLLELGYTREEISELVKKAVVEISGTKSKL